MTVRPRPDRLPDVCTFLKETPLFQELGENVIAYLSDDFRLRHYRKGEIVVHQGDESRSLSIVMHGKVRIYHLNLAGEETTVNILSPRQLIGEFALIDGQPRSATVQAITAATLLEISSERCLHHLEHVPGFALAMCRQIVNKVRWTSAYAETIARFDTAGRLLHFLITYNAELGEELEPGKRYLIDLGLNQSDLATLVGARRGWINHILQEWRKRGLVEFDRGKIIILDLPAVERERDMRIEMV